jgi:hypothetical protein
MAAASVWIAIANAMVSLRKWPVAPIASFSNAVSLTLAAEKQISATEPVNGSRMWKPTDQARASYSRFLDALKFGRDKRA